MQDGIVTLNRVCGVCTLQYSKYKCPRCAMQYCSLSCYKNHNVDCTEGFYADSAKATLHATRFEPEKQLDMLRMLQRVEALDAACEENSDDRAHVARGDDNDEELGSPMCDLDDDQAARLSRLLAKTRICESDLSEFERSEFKRLAADGSLGAQLQRANAWWTQITPGSITAIVNYSSKLMAWQFCDEHEAKKAKAAGAPTPTRDLPSLRHLTSRRPPAEMRFNLLEVVCAYTYTWRLHCGDFEDDPREAAVVLMALSQVLNGEQRGAYGSAEQALLRFSQATEDSQFATSLAFGAACLGDALTLLCDEGIAALALADARTLLAAASCLTHAISTSAAGSMSASIVDTSAGDSGLQMEETICAARTKNARRKVHFLETWWLGCSSLDRRAALSDLQFGVRKELQRRESVRIAAASVCSPVVKRSGI